MSYSAKETFKNGFGCDFCLLKGEDSDFECECLKPCGEPCCQSEVEE